MSTDLGSDDEHPDEIDVSGVVEYMQRNNLQRVKLTIQAMNVNEHDMMGEHEGALVLLAERPQVLSEDEDPSDLGLEGVFYVAGT